MKYSKLIILRGPSGSGKTTTAKKLFDGAKKRTVLIEQDYYRFIFNPPGGGTKPNSDTIHKLIKNDVTIALNDGYDVILEGILSVKAYSKVLEEIFSLHPEENYIYYFDISFDETVKRHLIRQQTKTYINKNGKVLAQDMKRQERLQEFGEKEMSEWYPSAHKSNHRYERVIPESFTQDELIKFIRKTSKF